MTPQEMESQLGEAAAKAEATCILLSLVDAPELMGRMITLNSIASPMVFVTYPRRPDPMAAVRDLCRNQPE